jgi:hypothetical protein
LTLITEKGTFTKDSSGNNGVNQDVTLSNFSGVTPKALWLLTTGQTANGSYSEDWQISYGFSDGTNSAVCAMASEDSPTTGNAGSSIRQNAAVALLNVAGGSPETLLARGSISFGTNKFTVTWDVNDTTAAIIQYFIIGGSDITNVKLVNTTLQTGTGSKTYTGVGFQGDFINILASNDSASSEYVDSSFCIGFATSDTAVGCVAPGIEDGGGNSDPHLRVLTDSLIYTSDSNSGAIDGNAGFSSWTSDGFVTSSTNQFDDPNQMFSYLVIKGGLWDVGNFTQPTSNGTQNVSITAARDPEGVMLFSGNSITTGSDDINDCRVSIGSADNSNEGSIWAGEEHGAPFMVNARISLVTKVIRLATEHATHTSSTTNAEADMNSMSGSGQFTLDWTTTDSTQRVILFFCVSIESLSTLYERSVNESFEIAASPVRIRRVLKTASGTLEIAASPVRMLSAFRSISETLEIDGAVNALRTVSKTASESLEIASDAIRMLFVNRSLSESFDIDGVVSRIRIVLKSLDETIESSASVDRIFTAIRTISDSLTIDGAVNVLKSISRSINETLEIDAIVSKVSTFFRTLDETLEIEDTVDRLRTVPKSISETLEIDAQVARMISIFRTLSESFTIEDTVYGAKIFFRTVDESLEISANVARMLSAFRTLSESVIVDAQVARIKTFIRTIDETLELEDIVDRSRYIAKSLSETLEIDAVVARVYKAYRGASETVIITADVIRARFINILVNESLELADIVTKIRTIQRSVTETLSLDAVVAKMLTASRTLSETLEIDVQVSRTKTFLRSLTENFEISANVARLKRAIRSVSNSFTIIDEVVGESGVLFQAILNETIVIQTQLSLFICWVGGRGPLPIIIKKVGRFFSILPQRNIRPYTIKSRFIKFSENQEVE